MPVQTIAPTLGATTPHDPRHRRRLGWEPTPEVSGVVAAVLSRAQYIGPGMDGLPRFLVDGGPVVTLTRPGMRRLLGHTQCRALGPRLAGVVRADLQRLADALHDELAALAVARSIEARDVAAAVDGAGR